MPDISSYAVFLIPVLVGVFVQAIKFVIFTLKHGWKPQYALTHGHMPSAHTAFIVSLVTSVGYYDGLDTGSFAIAVILAIIVIDDAVRLRMYMGDQGRYLNMLIRKLPIDATKFPHFKERLGHRVSEVIVGGALGFILSVLFISLFSLY